MQRYVDQFLGYIREVACNRKLLSGLTGGPDFYEDDEFNTDGLSCLEYSYGREGRQLTGIPAEQLSPPGILTVDQQAV